MTLDNKYYNAKPSKISNVGKDISGAKRMQHSTYETSEEKEIKKQKKATNKIVNTLKKSLKEELTKEDPSVDVLSSVLSSMFEAKHGLSIDDSAAFKIALAELRINAITSDLIKSFNSLIRDYNKTRRDLSGLRTYPVYAIKKLKKRYSSKAKFIELNGKKVSWKTFEGIKHTHDNTPYLLEHSSAVQFGNSVTDTERAYILNSLTTFLKKWNTDSIFHKVNLTDLSWSFGARGKSNSVAFYQPGSKVISVNRDNIGSIIHEIGHHIDYSNDLISNKISAGTVKAYRDKIKSGLDATSLRYYCDRKEIFARAFEAYCYKVKADFNVFAQCGDMYLPDLNDELLELIGSIFSSK